MTLMDCLDRLRISLTCRFMIPTSSSLCMVNGIVLYFHGIGYDCPTFCISLNNCDDTRLVASRRRSQRCNMQKKHLLNDSEYE